MTVDNIYPWKKENIVNHSQLLITTYERWTGKSLFNIINSPQKVAQQLFEADFALVSHGVESDPIFNYGNRKALELWEISWEDFTSMPSRKSAEEIVQEERNRLLAETNAKGFSSYSGIRISSNGKRFYIEDGIIWNLLDQKNQYWGQAAIFYNYKFIE